jgi:hypothetical protein
VVCIPALCLWGAQLNIPPVLGQIGWRFCSFLMSYQTYYDGTLNLWYDYPFPLLSNSLLISHPTWATDGVRRKQIIPLLGAGQTSFTKLFEVTSCVFRTTRFESLKCWVSIAALLLRVTRLDMVCQHTLLHLSETPSHRSISRDLQVADSPRYGCLVQASVHPQQDITAFYLIDVFLSSVVWLRTQLV